MAYIRTISFNDLNTPEDNLLSPKLNALLKGKVWITMKHQYINNVKKVNQVSIRCNVYMGTLIGLTSHWVEAG